MPETTDINRETLLNRVMRDNGIATMMFIQNIMMFIMGVLVALFTVTLLDYSASNKRLMEHMDGIVYYMANVNAELKARGIDIPLPEEQKEKD